MHHPTLLDIRTIVPRDRHALIFSTFTQLQPGEAMELINDHDPQPLHQQFQARLPDAFRWDYLERGPGIWRVAITRQAPATACCGGCGGGA